MQANLDQLIAERAKAIESKLIAWRRDIHEHPELAHNEFRTSKLVADHLKSLGYDEVRENIAVTGVVGILRGKQPGPVVGLRADMDALPIKEETDLPFASKVTVKSGDAVVPVMHACGHDAHTAMLMAAAEVLAELRDHIKGTVMLVFQPAEEGPPPEWVGASGAKLMLEEGLFADIKPDAMLGLHVIANGPRGTSGTIIYHEGIKGYCMDRFTITVHGKAAHAAKPWEGVDALLVGCQIVSALHTIPSRNVDFYNNHMSVAVGVFTSGTQHNVVPGECMMKGALRITDASSREYLEKRVEEIATQIAESAGAKATVEWTAWVPQLDNNVELTKKMHNSFVKAAGSPDKVEITGAAFLDDFSHFSKEVPSVFACVSAAQEVDDPRVIDGHHTSLFWINEDALLTGVKAYVHFVFDYMYME